MTTTTRTRKGGRGSSVKDPNVDRNGIRIEYVTGAATLEALGKKFGVRPPILRRWAKDDDWEQQRRDYRDQFHQSVVEAKIENAVVQLARWNEDTLLHAGLLREAARRQFQYQTEDGWRFRDDCSSKAISAAAAAYVASDKMARLALGASTENNDNVNKSLPATVEDFF